MTQAEKDKIIEKAKKSPLMWSHYSPEKWELHQVLTIENLEKILETFLNKGEQCS